MLAKEVQPPKARVPNSSHRLTQSDARQSGARIKGSRANARHRLTHSNACQRGAQIKGTLLNVSHRLTQSNVRQRGAALKGHSSQCESQTHPK